MTLRELCHMLNAMDKRNPDAVVVFLSPKDCAQQPGPMQPGMIALGFQVRDYGTVKRAEIIVGPDPYKESFLMYAAISQEWMPFSMHERIVLMRLDGNRFCADCGCPSVYEVLETHHCDNYNDEHYHSIALAGKTYKAWHWCGKCDVGCC